MYLELYGLKESPFNVTCDPEFFFEGTSHKEALAALFYGIQEKKGIVLITGEVGTGKTTVCKTILGRLSRDVKTAVIFNPYFSEVQLLKAIIADFGIKVTKKSRLDIVNSLNSFLLEVNSAGGNAVLIIDEAQNLTSRQLEQIRLLSNLETAKEKLLQIVLFGQPELKEKLKKFNLRQIYQRVFVQHHILPLKKEEIKRYINHRLNKAGITDIEILPQSHEVIYRFSQGSPRLINMICDRAMLCGFVKNSKAFGPELFEACIKELE